MIALLGEDRDSRLFHGECQFNRTKIIRFVIEFILDATRIIAVGDDLKPVKLDFLRGEVDGLLDRLYPAFQGLSGIAKNKFDVQFIAVLSGLLH